jgi:hypothetical protein
MGQYSYCRKLGPRFISGIAQASGKKNNVLKGFYCLSKVEGRECHINRLNSVPSMNDFKFPRNRPRTGHDEVPVGGVPCWSAVFNAQSVLRLCPSVVVTHYTLVIH